MNFVYLYGLMIIEAIILGSELVASQLTHSLLILTDAYHTLYNMLTIVLLIINFKMSDQTSVKNTFGWARIEVLGMLANMTFLVALTFSLLVEGIQQLVHASHEISNPTNYYLLFTFGVIGLISNLLYFNLVSDAVMSQIRRRTDSLGIEEKVLPKDMIQMDVCTPSTSSQKKISDQLLPNKTIVVERSPSVEEERCHQNKLFLLLRDLTGSVLLILCGVCIMITLDLSNLAHIIDPIFGITSALLFCATLYPNIRNTGLILLQTVPENINVGRLKLDIQEEFPIILNIHDLHVWELTTSRIIATCHIILPKLSSESFDEFSKSLNDFFQRQGIILATVQPEFDQRLNPSQKQPLCELSCLMKCSKFSKTNCDSYTCCTDDNNDCIHKKNKRDLKDSGDSQLFEEVVITKTGLQ